MPSPSGQFDDVPDAPLVDLAQGGDRDAFAALVHRRQSWMRNLMRRFSRDPVLADDLAQEVFLRAFKRIHQLKDPEGFGPWLRRIAVNMWLQNLRKADALRGAEEFDETVVANTGDRGLAMDLDEALGMLPESVRLCVILSYHEGMTHGEIAEYTKMPLGTVKSHTRRGAKRLQTLLAAYRPASSLEEDL